MPTSLESLNKKHNWILTIVIIILILIIILFIVHALLTWGPLSDVKKDANTITSDVNKITPKVDAAAKSVEDAANAIRSDVNKITPKVEAAARSVEDAANAIRSTDQKVDSILGTVGNIATSLDRALPQLIENAERIEDEVLNDLADIKCAWSKAGGGTGNIPLLSDFDFCTVFPDDCTTDPTTMTTTPNPDVCTNITEPNTSSSMVAASLMMGNRIMNQNNSQYYHSHRHSHHTHR